MKGPLKPFDPELIEFIRTHYLIRPSHEPYSFRYASPYRNAYISGQLTTSIVKDLFGHKRGGFFVEAGALDGEYMSHTLAMEMQLGWSVSGKYTMQSNNHVS